MDYLVRQKAYRLFISWRGLGQSSNERAAIEPSVEVVGGRGRARSHGLRRRLIKTDEGSPHFERHWGFAGDGRQLSRLLKLWVAEAGLDPTDYGVDSLRRTKALHILKGTGDLQAVRALLGHAKIESTARYLGLETKADPIAVCRAFDI